MSETLVQAFQSQLSIVMETVMKTVMYEVTRLVEDGFLEEVRRRKQEVELLRLRLEFTEKKLKGAKRKGICEDCGKTGPPNEASEDSTSEVHSSNLGVCGLKQEEEESECGWGSCEQETQSPQEAVRASSISSPVMVTVPTDEDVKEEEDFAKRPSGVSHRRETPEPSPPDQNCEERWSPDFKPDLQSSPAHTYAETEPDTHTQGTVEDTLRLLSTESVPEQKRVAQVMQFADSILNPSRIGGGSGNTCDWTRRRGGVSPTWTGFGGLIDPDSGDVRVDQLVRDQLFNSVPSGVRLTSPELMSVSIKQEVIVGEEEEVSTLSQHRIRPEVSQNRITQKAPGGVMKQLGPRSKHATGLALPRATHQPVRTHLHLPSPNNGAASSNPTPQIVASQHRSNSSSLPPQRHPQGDKGRPGPVSLSRTTTQWVSIKNQHPLHHLLQGGSQPHHPHPGKVPLRCGQCGKIFPHPSNLRAHLQTHSGERPFSCTLCGRSFTKLSNLKAHRRVHTGERPYCCQACGKRFTQKCNLKRHQRVHLEHGL